MPKRFQSPAVAWRHLVTSDAQEFPNRNIQNNGARFWQVVKIINSMFNLDFAAELTKISSERVCNLLRTAAGDWPADNMPGKPEHQTKRGGDRRFQRKNAMCSDSSEKRAGGFV